jgi:hypothetical protein
MDLREVVDRVFVNREVSLKTKYNQKLINIKTAKKLVLFIVDDFEKGVVAGIKEKDFVKYDIQQLFHRLKIEEVYYRWNWKECLCILRGLGFQVEEDISNYLTIIETFHR